MPRTRGTGSEKEELVREDSSCNGSSSAFSTAMQADSRKTSQFLHKEGASSSANLQQNFSNSLQAQPLGFSLRRAILIGRRGGQPGTPAPSWKVSSNSVEHNFQNSRHLHHVQHGEGLAVVSARKLAASLWELQELSFSRAPSTCMQEKIQESFQGPEGQPALSQISKGSQRKPAIQAKFKDRGRVHSKGEKCKGHQNLPDYKREITVDDGHSCTPRSLVPNSRKGFLSNLSYESTTTGDLLKLLNYVWSLEEQHTSSMSLVDKLRAELDEAQSQLQGLLLDEQKYCKEVESTKTRIAEERALLQEQQEQYITGAVQSVVKELENERKSKQNLEALHKKVTKDFRAVRKSLARALQELEQERNARRLMEEVCDELAREIGQDKARVEELKLESVKVREEVEEERKMLQMAEIWREERVQMKLIEAKLELEEKNTALNKLRSQLKAFLKAKRTGDTMLYSSRQSTSIVIGSNLSDSFHVKEQQGTPSVSCRGDSGHDQQGKKSAWLSDSEDYIDLDSIELDHELLVRPASSSSRQESFRSCGLKLTKRRLSNEIISANEDNECVVGRSQEFERPQTPIIDQPIDPGGREGAEAEGSAQEGVVQSSRWIDDDGTEVKSGIRD